MVWPCDVAVNAVGSCGGTQLDRIFSKLILTPITLVLNCNNNVKKLYDSLTKLDARRQSVQHEVDEAKGRAEEIELEVTNWMAKAALYDSEEARRRRNQLEQKAMKRCFMGFCLNPVARYKLSKKADEDARAVDQLAQDSHQFRRISFFPYDRHRREEAAAADDGFQDFDSRSKVLKQIMDSLKDPSIKRIGLHGLPGVGKTTLANEVKRRSLKEKLFDAVVLAAVTETPEVKRIQAEIARDLDLHLPIEIVEWQAADRIKAKLREKKNVLVILDDVWTGLDLNEIGIPLEHAELKILITSRNRDVLSRKLCSNKTIEVGQLQDKEAWKLFVGTVGADAERFDLKGIAIQIVQKCGGLPLAIVTLGKALKGRESDDWWHDALYRLSNPSPANFEGVSDEVYAAIEFSYNHLKEDGLKETFLLCSFLCQFLRSSEDNIEVLVRHTVGLHLFPNITTIKATRHRVLTFVSMLKDAALLIDVNSSRKFGIHDVVRDVTIAIAARDNCGLLLEDQKRPDMEALTKVNWIFLMDQAADIIGDLANDMEFPQLTLFHLQHRPSDLRRKGQITEIPTSFFKGKLKLKVLHIVSTYGRMHQEYLSLSFLTNLTNLCSLTIGGVGDVTGLGELKNLEVLCISGDQIKELPSEVGKLTRLKVLDLRGCWNLKVISPNVIANLSRLEEIYFGRRGPGYWDELAAELAHLDRLTVLHVNIREVRISQTDFADLFSRLESFQIFIGAVGGYHGSLLKYSRVLMMQMDEGSRFDPLIGRSLKRTEALRLGKMKGVKNVVPELDAEGFQELKMLDIYNDLEMQSLVNSVDRDGSNAFPILETLNLFRMHNLERINHGWLGATSFSKLKEVFVGVCHQIKILFSLSMVKQLHQLQEISIYDCKKMVGIFDEEEQGDTNSEVVEATDQKVELGQLRSLYLNNVPEFISFCYGKKSSLIDEDKQNQLTNNPSSRPNPLFNSKVVFPNLEKLMLESIEIKMICHITTTAHFIMNLATVTIKNCDNLELLFSSSVARGLENLRHLEIHKCKNIRELFATENVEGMEVSISFPQLNVLVIRNLQNLVRFYSGNRMIEFPSLKQLTIVNCPKFNGLAGTCIDGMADTHLLCNKQVAFPNLEALMLESIEIKMICHITTTAHYIMNLAKVTIKNCDNLELLFSSSVARGLEKLWWLEIRECKNIRELFATENVEGMEVSISFPQLYILVISDLQNLVRFYSGNHMIEFPSLKQLIIKNCPKFKGLTGTCIDGMADRHLLCNKQVAFPNLEALMLELIEIKMICHITTTAHFIMNLGKVTIKNCDNLELLFSSSVARGLEKLWHLEIQKCKNIRELFATENVEGMEVSISFPRLYILVISDLQNLVRFYSGNHMIEFPSLKELIIENCPKFKGLTGTCIDGMADKHLLCNKQVVIPNLEQLEVKRIEKIPMIGHMICYCIPNLTRLTIGGYHNLESLFSSSIATSLVNLRHLKINNCKNIREILVTENVEDMAGLVPFSQLNILEIDALPNLVGFYFGNYIMEFPSLKELKIFNCPRFKMFTIKSTSTVAMADIHPFFNEQVKFPILEGLTLSSIETKFLFTSSTVKSFKELKGLCIRNCGTVEEIIACLDDDVKDGIVFFQLEYLELSDLPRLSSFCSVECNFKFPSLEHIRVEGCPNMQIFSKGELSTPKLQRVHTSVNLFTAKGHWNGNLNTTIQQLFVEKTSPEANENMMPESILGANEEARASMWRARLMPSVQFRWLEWCCPISWTDAAKLPHCLVLKKFLSFLKTDPFHILKSMLNLY